MNSAGIRLPGHTGKQVKAKVAGKGEDKRPPTRHLLPFQCEDE